MTAAASRVAAHVIKTPFNFKTWSMRQNMSVGIVDGRRGVQPRDLLLNVKRGSVAQNCAQ